LKGKKLYKKFDIFQSFVLFCEERIEKAKSLNSPQGHLRVLLDKKFNGHSNSTKAKDIATVHM
jgi:hypothetical protein